VPQNTKYHLLADLLSTLEAEGFVLGTGKHLQAQELLRKLPDDLELESLKTLLCPIFVTNRREQERFYDLFDASYRRVKAMEDMRTKPKVQKKKKDVELWRNILLALFLVLAGWAGYILEIGLFDWWQNPTHLLLILLAGGGIYFALNAISRWHMGLLYVILLIVTVGAGQTLKRLTISIPEPITEVKPFDIEPGSTRSLKTPLEKDELVNVLLCNQQRADTSALLGSYFVDSLGNLTIIARDSFQRAFRDTICVLATYEFIQDTTLFVAKYALPEEVEEPDDETTQPALALLDTMAPPFPRNITELEIDADQQRKAEFYQRNAWWIKLLLTLLFGAILWSLVQWLERKQERLVAELEQRDKPPYIWDIHADQGEEVLFTDSARILLNQVRLRRLDDAFKLDVKRTVEATVKSAGRIDFKYKQQTIPPDYLLLIDRHGMGDHRALIFDHLYDAFKANEVNVERFFYAGDPRVCFNERHPAGVNLRELQHRYGEARLLIVGNGYELLSPASGELSKWARIFTNWRERALFTPQPVEKWGRREEYLQDYFYLMPASIQSLGMTIEELGANEPRHPDELLLRIEDAPREPIEIQGDIISTLRRHYAEPMVQWIAACAVYPTLQWDVTLFLGSELSAPNEPSLLTIENLLRLTQLPWFVNGKIPDAAREDLIAYLEEQGLENRIRRRLNWLLTHAAQPMNDSVAYDEYQINKVANEWRYTDDRRRRRELEEQLARYYAAGHQIDSVVFKKLDRERRSLDFEAPSGWKDYIYYNGDPFFGMRDWLWALPLWAILTIGIMLFNPNYEVCRGEQRAYRNTELCLTYAADYLLYYEYLIHDEIKAQNLPKAGSLLSVARQYYSTGVMELDENATEETPIQEAFNMVYADSASFLRNISAHYFNAGVRFYNDRMYFLDSINLIEEGQLPLPQNEYEYESALQERLARNERWATIADSLAAVSCKNFQRGSQLHINATQDTSYEFTSAMMKVCEDMPQDQPEEEDFEGFVTNADDQPIADVTVKTLNGNIVTQTAADGSYSLTLPTDLRDSLIKIEFSKQGYADLTQNLPVQNPLPVVELEPLRPQTIGVEVFEARSGYKGLRTNTGNVILPARYNQIELDPASGLYRVQRISKESTRMGYVNREGEFVIPLEYRVLGFLKDGMIVAAKDRFGYLDSRGNIELSFIYESASDFQNGEAEVVIRRFGQRFEMIINKEGRCIRRCPPAEDMKAKVAEQITSLDKIEPFSLYFNPNEPEPTNSQSLLEYSYLETFGELVRQRDRFYNYEEIQQQQSGSIRRAINKDIVDRFFANQVQGNYDQFVKALESINAYLQNSNGVVEITLRGYAVPNNTTTTYKRLMARARTAAVHNTILNFNDGVLQQYIDDGRLRINQEAIGEPQLDIKLRSQIESASNPFNLTALLQSKVEVDIRFAD